MSVKTRNRVWLLSCLCVLVVSLLFLAFYKADGSPIVAVSTSSVEEIASTMSTTKHIRFVEDLGTTSNGERLFSYRWVNFTIFEIFSCAEEQYELMTRLGFSLVEVASD